MKEPIKPGQWYFCKYGYDVDRVKILAVTEQGVVIEHGSLGTKLVTVEALLAPCNAPILTVNQWWNAAYISVPVVFFIIIKLFTP